MEENRFNSYKDLSSFVYAVFTNVLKENGVYHIFRVFNGCGNCRGDCNDPWHNNNIYSALVYSLPSFEDLRLRSYIARNENNFLYISSPNELLNNLYYTIGNIDDYRKDGDSDTKVKQKYIMHIINTLIHNCLEKWLRDKYPLLEKIGKETFNRVCEELFGKGFKDETEEDIPKELRDNIKVMCEQLINASSYTYDNEFIRQVFGNELSQRLTQASSTSDGFSYDFENTIIPF